MSTLPSNDTGSLPAPPVIPRLISSAKLGWLLVLACILIQFLSFRQMIIRDIEGIYPFSFDQAVYLRHAYEAFEKMRTGGLAAGLKDALFSSGKPNGVLLQAEAALSYLLFGANRSTSLLVGFIHFSVLQAAIFAFFRRLTARNDAGFVALGLLLLTLSRYFSAGGLNDFRLDLASSALYGICLSALLASDLFLNRRWSLLLGVAVVFQVVTRFVAASYVFVALGLVLLYLVKNYFSVNQDRALAAQRLRTGVITVVGAGIASLPFFLANLSDLYQYYVVGHLVGNEAATRAAEAGVTDRLSAILFYPKSLLIDHLGFTFVVIFVASLILAAVWRIGTIREHDSRLPIFPLRTPLAITCLWIGIPLALFTYDAAKSPVVASVFVGPVAILAGLLWVGLAGPASVPSFNRARRRVLPAFAGSILLAGVVFSLSKQVERLPRLQAAKDSNELYSALDELTADILKSGIKNPLFVTDRNVEYFNGTLVKVMIYERTGHLVNAVELLAGGVLPIAKDAALQALNRADFALITLDHPAAAKSFVYPFDQGMYEIRNELLASATAQMVPMRRVRMGDHLFEIFARPHVEATGVSGGWLRNTGAKLRINTNALRRFSHVVLSGPTILSGQLRGGLACNAYFIDEPTGRREPLTTTANLASESYAIAIDATALRSVQRDFVEIELEFPTYFVPKERGINADDRKLVVSEPQSIRLVDGPANYPAALAPSKSLPAGK